MRGVRHHLSAKVPEMDSKVIICIICNTGKDTRSFMYRGLDGDALRHWLLASDHVLAVQRPDKRGLAHLAVADEDRAHALELLGQRAIAQRP